MADHPWEQFLRARHVVILWMLAEGDTTETIAHVLSMDAEQVRLISLAPLDDAGSPPGGSAEGRPE